MKPFAVASWVAKFVVSLTFLLVVIPGCLYAGMLGVIYLYEKHQETLKIQHQAHVAWCSDEQSNLDTAVGARSVDYSSMPAGAHIDFGGKGPGKADDGVKVWHFEDGTELPLDEFIARTKKNLEQCK